MNRFKHGVTILHDAEGGYTHTSQTVLMTVITMYEYQEFKDIIQKYDEHAFVSISARMFECLENLQKVED